MQPGADVFFLLMGAILVFAMHGGFAFLEAGTVRHKNQVNALVKSCRFRDLDRRYFCIGYAIAYGVNFFATAATISGARLRRPGTLVNFFFLRRSRRRCPRSSRRHRRTRQASAPRRRDGDAGRPLAIR